MKRFTIVGLFFFSLFSSLYVGAVEIDIDHEFAVHATDQFKIIDGKIVILARRKPLTEEGKELLLKNNKVLLAKAQIASKEKGTDFRPTSHWSLGELVRPINKTSWETKKFAFVPYTNPIEMAMIYDIMASSMEELQFLKTSEQGSILEEKARKLLKTSVVLKRFLLQDLY